MVRRPDKVTYVLEEDSFNGDWHLYRQNIAGQYWGVAVYSKEYKHMAQQVCDFMNAYVPYEAMT